MSKTKKKPNSKHTIQQKKNEQTATHLNTLTLKSGFSPTCTVLKSSRSTSPASLQRITPVRFSTDGVPTLHRVTSLNCKQKAQRRAWRERAKLVFTGVWRTRDKPKFWIAVQGVKDLLHDGCCHSITSVYAYTLQICMKNVVNRRASISINIFVMSRRLLRVRGATFWWMFLDFFHFLNLLLILFNWIEFEFDIWFDLIWFELIWFEFDLICSSTIRTFCVLCVHATKLFSSDRWVLIELH